MKVKIFHGLVQFDTDLITKPEWLKLRLFFQIEVSSQAEQW